MKEVLIFTSKNCMPCMLLKTELLGFVGPVKYFDVDEDAGNRMAECYKVTSLPTCVFLDENSVIRVQSGFSRDLPGSIKDFVQDKGSSPTVG